MQFFLTRNSGPSSLIIRARMSLHKGRRERWSHGLVWLGGAESIDATFKLGGVHRRPLVEALSHSAPRQRILVSAPLPREAEALAWGLAQEGKPYDTRAIWGWTIGERDWHDPSAWFCFEYIAAWIEAGSAYRFEDKRRVTGADLEAAALALGGFVGVE